MAELRTLGNDCPFCAGALSVTQMTCDHCHLALTAVFPMSRLGSLPVEHQRFIEMFILSSGNLKEIAEQVGVSYPTVRSRLDKVIQALRIQISKTRQVKGTLLDAVSTSRGSAEEAARLIKDI